MTTRSASPEEEQAAADLYAASLLEPDEPNPHRNACFRTSTPHRSAADTEAVLKGAPASWKWM